MLPHWLRAVAALGGDGAEAAGALCSPTPCSPTCEAGDGRGRLRRVLVSWMVFVWR